jgi:hypothetical protein
VISRTGRAGRRLLRGALRSLGFLVYAAIAVALSILLVYFYRDWNPGGSSGYTGLPGVFLVVEPLVVLGVWVGLWAYARRRLGWAAVFALAAALGPWGINVTLAAVPIALAVCLFAVASSGAISRRRGA